MNNGLVSTSRVVDAAPSLGIHRGLPSTVDGRDPEAIRQVAIQFESLFLHQVFKTMRATVPEGELSDAGFGGKVFTDMLDQQYADMASSTGQLGIADAIVRQFTAGDLDPEAMLRQEVRLNRSAALASSVGQLGASSLGQLGAVASGQLGASSTRPTGQLANPDVTARQFTGGDLDPQAMPRGEVKPNRSAALAAYAGAHAETGWTRPIAGARVSSHFGMRKLGDEDHARQHHGIDMAAPTGTPIRAARTGTVVFAGRRGGYGNTIIVDHGGEQETLYAHADTLAVKKGDRVIRGQEIATVGSTGRSTGPHLHFEIRRRGVAIDPAAPLGIRR
jgi:flagellar protein FlgJ